MLYVEAQKAMYGTLKAAFLFYKKFFKGMKTKGFVVNPYEPCVANKIIGDKQMTISWHVDDVKVSHVDAKEVDEYVKWLKTMYEDEIGKVKVSRGKIHDYLGMTLDYTVPGKVKINMVEYVKRMINDFPEGDLVEMKTPAANHLFEVRENVEKVPEDKAVIFHNLVARGLFLCKRARPDIQTAIAFLTTRVSEPDQDDWKKLRRLIGYLKGTEKFVLTLCADSAWVAKWYVDAAYAVHNNMKSHTGGVLSLGEGAVYATSTKQKINTKSSTESELVGADDVMGQILWTNYFLEAQGYKTNDTVLFQDNKSAILLEKNGKASSGKRTKHINIRYFLLKTELKARSLMSSIAQPMKC